MTVRPSTSGKNMTHDNDTIITNRRDIRILIKIGEIALFKLKNKIKIDHSKPDETTAQHCITFFRRPYKIGAPIFHY